MSALDASALLAWIYTEDGHETVDEQLDGARVSAVNWSEVLQKITAKGGDATQLGEMILALGVEVADFDATDARHTAALYRDTRAHGLSLGDRACLALAHRLGKPAVTADRAWKALDLDAVEIDLIR